MDQSDREFLLYCRAHAASQRGAFVPAQLARLYVLLGDEASAARWRAIPHAIIGGYKHVVLDLVDRIERNNP